MAKRSKSRKDRKRAGSDRRDKGHRTGGDWTTLSIPEGVDIWKPEAKSYRIDIVPYETGEGNPYADKGQWYYERTYYIHRGIGPNNNSYVCPAKTADKPCPICEYRSKLLKDPDTDEEVTKALRPKERQLWLIRDRDDSSSGVQLWDFSHWNFGRLLDKLRDDADEDDPHITDFDDPEAGAVLKVSFNEEKGGGYSFLEAYNIAFKPRPDGLDEEVLEHGICLDDLVKIEDYEKLKTLLFQDDDDDDDDDESEPEPKKEKKPNRDKCPSTAKEADLSVGDMVDHDKMGLCKIKRISKDGTSLTLTDDDGDIYRGIGVDEVIKSDVPVPEEDEDEDEPAKEEKKPKPKEKAKEEKESEEEEGWEDDWDE